MRRAALLTHRCIDVISFKHLTLKQCILRLIASFSLLILFNEFIVYYLFIWQCNWPYTTAPTTRVMVIADTHLLGIYKGHWLDKLKREWQMGMAFQASIHLLGSPDAIFFLGDLFDEGLWGTNEVFDSYTQQFQSLFPTPEGVRRFAVAGNHDIGFHYEIFPQRIDRFNKEYRTKRGSPSVELVELNGNIFILLNSMAMEGDGCHLCGEAERAIERLSVALQCARNQSSSSWCNDVSRSGDKINVPYSRPILMQHFPLHRKTDQECGPESGRLPPPSLLIQKLRPSHDCLSKESTRFLIDRLHPRAAFGGHSHYGCRKWWTSPENFWEHTVPSFSWRNNYQPSFLLLSVSPSEINVSKCDLPNEYMEIGLYVVWAVVWGIVLLRRWRMVKRLIKKKEKQGA